MKSPACSRSLHMRTKRGIYVSASTTCPASSSRIFRVFYQQSSLPALSIVKNVSHARKTDFSHEKTCCIMDPWLITGGVAGSEPTNLVFCRYFERPTQFFYQSSKEWAQGGEDGPSARSGVGRLRESGDFVVSTICLLLLGHK